MYNTYIQIDKHIIHVKKTVVYIYILETTMMRVIILLICMNAFLMASIDASSIRGSAKGPGAEILSTIHTLEKTEAIMKKTQAAMQAKIDKLNANMAVGMDKHIDGTVNKIVNAYHLKEKETVANAATKRINQWASGKNNTKEEEIKMPNVDPAKIVAEEQAEEDKQETKKDKGNTVEICKKDLARGKIMMQNAKRTNAGNEALYDAMNVRDNAQMCLLENRKSQVTDKIDEAKAQMSGSGWNAADMSPTQVAEWKSDMERNMKFAMRLDQAISAIQGAVDSRVAHASEEKVKQMEKNAEDSENEAEEAEQTVEDPKLAKMKEENEKAKAKALEQSKKMEELRKNKAGKQQMEEMQKAMAAQARNEAAQKKAMGAQEDELRAKHGLEMAKAKGASEQQIKKMEKDAKKLKEEVEKKEAATKASEEAAKAAADLSKKKQETEFNKKQEETQKKMDKQAEENEKAMKKQEEASKKEKKAMEEKSKAEARMAAAKASGNAELMKMAKAEEEKAKKGQEEAEKNQAKMNLKAQLAMEREKAARLEMDKAAAKSAEEIKELRDQLKDVSAKEALSRGKAEGLEKVSKCCEGNKFDPKTLLEQVSAIAKASMQNSNKGGIGAEDMMKMMQGMQSMKGGAAAATPAAMAAAMAAPPPPPQRVIIDIQHNQVSSDGGNSNGGNSNSNNKQQQDESLKANSQPTGQQTKPNIGSQTKYEDHIQKAVDGAVDRLLTKTKERRAAEDKKEEKDREEAERVERRRLELEAVNQKADEATKKEKAAEEKAKDASADEELMKAQMKKQKEELKKLKTNGLKQQQMITEMGEKAKEKEDRLKDISDTF